MPYIQVAPDIKIFVQDGGNGKPIVFIHGWPYSHAMFEYQYLPLLKHGYRCIGVDLRGYGQSDKPYGEYNFDVFADDVYQVLDVLALQDVTLVGFSMGGAVAVRYMGKHLGARVAKVALLAAATPCLTQKADFPQGLNRAVYDSFLSAIEADRAQLLVGFGEATFHKPISSALANWFTTLGMQASAHATAMSVVALRDADLRADLEKITVPTVIMHGVHDKVAPLSITAAINHARIKGSQLIQFENSGHGLFLDEKEKLNQELRHFIN